jgi:hypothetical protein
MPHTRLDRITYTVHGDTEADLIHEARARLKAVVTDVEQWTLAIDAESRDQTVPHLAGTVTATRRRPPASKAAAT